jgi:hypothetical protein
MKIGELAFSIHVHRVHAWRLAKAGVVPGTKRTNGGHFYFVKSKSLTRWINFMKAGGAHRRKEMSRAYQREYGKGYRQTDTQKKAEKELWGWFKHHQKKSVAHRREFKGYVNQNSDLFEEFFYDTDDLIRILKELVTWHECKLKTKMKQLSESRLTVLRNLINKWLVEQQSART